MMDKELIEEITQALRAAAAESYSLADDDYQYGNTDAGDERKANGEHYDGLADRLDTAATETP
jgi:hypothetical protein